VSSRRQWAELVHTASRPAAGKQAPDQLHSAVSLGLDVAPQVIGCSITEITDLGYRTSASSGELPLHLDAAQYAAGDGPCLAAARTARSHHLVDLTTEPQFRVFAAAAVERGVLSSLSVPVVGASHPAAVNLYASSPGSFGAEQSRAIAAFLARCVRTVIDAGAAAEQDEDPRLGAARERGREVARAQDRLIATGPLTRAAAFSRLIELSRVQHCSIHEVVREVLADPGRERA
jgi:hypothetical protein